MYRLCVSLLFSSLLRCRVVQKALETLDEVDYLTKEIILNDFMPYFESITTEKGGIQWMLRPKSDYPCIAGGIER